MSVGLDRLTQSFLVRGFAELELDFTAPGAWVAVDDLGQQRLGIYAELE